MNKPDVYKSANSDIWIVFGEAKVEDMANAAQQAQHLMKTAAQVSAPKKEDAPPALVPVDDDDEQVDASGIEPKDIEIVMSQANVSRSNAIKALKASDNDIVNAIMDLTM